MAQRSDKLRWGVYLGALCAALVLATLLRFVSLTAPALSAVWANALTWAAPGLAAACTAFAVGSTRQTAMQIARNALLLTGLVWGLGLLLNTSGMWKMVTALSPGNGAGFALGLGILTAIVLGLHVLGWLLGAALARLRGRTGT